MPGDPQATKQAIILRLAEKLRSFREASGLSQHEVARRAGTSRSAVARLELGSAMPNIVTLLRIADALEVDLALDLYDPKEPTTAVETGGSFSKDRIKVVIADSQRLFAQALAVALAVFDDLEVHFVSPKGGLTTGLEAAGAVAKTKPDVALLDYWMADMDGSALTRAALTWAPEAKVLLLSWFHSPLDVQAALEAGAQAFLPKTLSVEDVADAIRRAHAGEPLVYSSQLHNMVEAITRREEVSKDLWQRVAGLTPREVDVLRMVSSGRPFKDIARDMTISQGTLRVHLNKIMSKTGTTTRMEAVALARATGLIKS